MQEDINQYFVPIILKNDNVVKIKRRSNWCWSR
jgi:hypothetical protein